MSASLRIDLQKAFWVQATLALLLRANDLFGRWRHGTVRGKLVAAGWGAKLGYPRLLLDLQRGPTGLHCEY